MRIDKDTSIKGYRSIPAPNISTILSSIFQINRSVHGDRYGLVDIDFWIYAKGSGGVLMNFKLLVLYCHQIDVNKWGFTL